MLALLRDIGPVLLGRVDRLFLKESLARRSAMSTAETLQAIPRRWCSSRAVASGCS
jgi:hypothetical protein